MWADRQDVEKGEGDTATKEMALSADAEMCRNLGQEKAKKAEYLRRTEHLARGGAGRLAKRRGEAAAKNLRQVQKETR